MESTPLKLWRYQIIPRKCICNFESKFYKIHQPLLNKNLKHYYLGVAFLIWGLLSSKIQFFNEKEESIESSVYIFKVLIIFSNLNSASFREGSRISVNEVWGKRNQYKCFTFVCKYVYICIHIYLYTFVCKYVNICMFYTNIQI